MPHPMPHVVLEQIILEDLRTIIRSIENLREIVEQNRESAMTVRRTTEAEKIRLHAELEKVKKLKKSVYEDYREELISREEFVAYRQDYMKKEELLTKQLESLEEKSDMEKQPDVFSLPWIQRLLDLREIERLDRDIVMEMIHEIRVYENHKIKIIYNFSDELEDLFANVYEPNETQGA